MRDCTRGTDATIASKPVSVDYTCPYCDEEVSEPFDSFCSDIWSGYCMTCCPKCDKDVMLEEVEYD
ncbi:hypothetical protein [Gordonibacter urolithinfaciens]|uniref:hypothetical protein n=1 Tax=Gordonibacter urolithinfaciens TaxID=1335613 RepID=UPI001D06FB45|nr:hypothetical protein [Gordonibacter urolithinfaciens]MCB7085778.1 hypothetical protein [Gordonibacter urolithinfaciens]